MDDIPLEYRKALGLAEQGEVVAAEQQLEVDLRALSEDANLSDETKADLARALVDGATRQVSETVSKELEANRNTIQNGPQLTNLRVFARMFRHSEHISSLSVHVLGQLREFGLERIRLGDIEEGKELFFEALTLKTSPSFSGMLDRLSAACREGGASEDNTSVRDELLGAVFELLEIARAENLRSCSSAEIAKYAGLFAESGCVDESVELYDFAIERAYEEAERDSSIADYHLGFYKTDEYREPLLAKKQATLDAHNARIEEYEVKRASLVR